MPSSKRVKLKINGLVQGVGFRPYVYNLAHNHNLTGWTKNSANGVLIEIQGLETKQFIKALTKTPPANAIIKKIEQCEIQLIQEDDFQIIESQTCSEKNELAADSSVCAACLKDLFNPDNPYYLYPFVSCSHCGPRYSISRKTPYDRAKTTMASFKMCSRCENEYSDAENRRFHAQTIACAECGPRLSLPVDKITTQLQRGMILAIKGLSGFHLLCDATNEAAVKRLRQRKQRPEKPLAVMVANIASAKQLAHINDKEAQLLQSQQRPIVVLSKKNNLPISESVAPDLKWLGIMLPYTPLHYLLFHQACGQPDDTDWLEQAQSLCLVMTSGNNSGEPLIIDGYKARLKLSDIADLIIDHDREIVTRCDDSVLRVINQQTAFIRRARGYAPLAIKLPHAIPATLAVGGHLKNTICITRDDEAFISQHIGDLNNAASLHYFKNSIGHLLSLLNVTPERVAHDLHPDFHSTRHAQSLGLPCYAIQHHHAHLAAVAAEHNISQPAIGLALDGFGLGSDHNAWGGELLLLNGPHFQRLSHLQPLKQPGGDIATREPWRMAASFLQKTGRGDEIAERFQAQPAARNIAQLLQKNIHSPTTSSGGRLFDVASGLLHLKHTSSFEGQAAMQLEGLVTETTVMHAGWLIKDNQLDFSPLLTAMLDMPPVAAANLFHGTLIEALSEWTTQMAQKHETDIVLLSGGCFLNQVLTNGLIEALQRQKFKAYLQTQSPINDGGISLGQAWITGNL